MKTIVANWKMNPLSRDEARELVSFLLQYKKEHAKESTLIFCSPFVYLASLAESYPEGIFGAQNCHGEEKGAFTGEISPAMLADVGITHVILGHSERRKYFGEMDVDVNKKVKIALKHGLAAIVCVGEKTRQGVTEAEYLGVIENQVRGSLAGLVAEEIAKIIVAYEPVWAIGTGMPDTPLESSKSIIHIRKIVADMCGDASLAQKLTVLYGGSVTAANAEGFLKERGIDGALVGGASVKKEELLAILKIADKYAGR